MAQLGEAVLALPALPILPGNNAPLKFIVLVVFEGNVDRKVQRVTLQPQGRAVISRRSNPTISDTHERASFVC